MKKIYDWFVLMSIKLNDYDRFWFFTTALWIGITVFDAVNGVITTKTFPVYIMLLAMLCMKTGEENRKDKND